MSLPPNWIIFAGLGAIIGGGIGYFNRNRGKASRFTANWKQGATYGAIFGMVFFYVFGNTLMPYPHPKNLKEVDEAAFRSELASLNKPLVVDFFATWCGPCKTLAPRLDKLAGEFGDRIQFLSVNVDKSPALAARFNVSTIPTLVYFGKDGQVTGASLGVPSESGLRAKLQALAGTLLKSLPDNLGEFSK